MTPLERARQLRALGLSVIPVPPPRSGVAPGQPGDGKVPILPWRDFQSRLPTDDELAPWFSDAPMNLAVVTGAVSGVVVVDADSEAGRLWCARRLRYTPWQTKTSRGFHLWYRHPGVLVRNASKLATRDGRLAIDVRGDGGYVIAPGSQHASGAIYMHAGDWSRARADVPSFWPGWLRRVGGSATAVHQAAPPTGPILDRARGTGRNPQTEIGAGFDVAVLQAASSGARVDRRFTSPPRCSGTGAGLATGGPSIGWPRRFGTRNGTARNPSEASADG